MTAPSSHPTSLNQRIAVLLLEPTSERAQRLTCRIIGTLLALATLLHLFLVGAPVFPIDDAYITLHNAQVALAGEDPNYRGVATAFGATSLPHLALVMVLLLILPAAHALLASQWIAVILYSLGLLHLAFTHRASVVFATALLLTGLTIGLTGYHLFNGLETGLAMAGVVWALAWVSKPERTRVWATGLLLGTLPFLRPELIALAGPLTLLLAVKEWRREGTWRGPARVALWSLLGVLPWLAGYAISSHTLGPATVSAKRLFFAEGCLDEELRRFWVKAKLEMFSEGLGLVFVMGALLCALRGAGRAALLFMVVFITAYYMRLPGALGHYHQRYLYLFVPCFAYGFAAAAESDTARVRQLALALLLMSSAGAVVWDIPRAWAHSKRSRDFTRMELEGVAGWTREHVPKDALVLIHDAGYIAYATELHLIDFVGLKTPEAVALHAEHTWPTCGAGRVRAVHALALERRPDHLIMMSGWDTIFNITPALRALGWDLERIGPPPRSDGKDPAYLVYRMAWTGKPSSD